MKYDLTEEDVVGYLGIVLVGAGVGLLCGVGLGMTAAGLLLWLTAALAARVG